ncbi:MAG: T9SS type A sorting domain-containing protein, partial [Bacteroidales bacterium]|nr:T9SS type A sorting domain-containing protein [Bacteroidales bacterium]
DFNQDGTVTQAYGRLDRIFIDFKSGSAGTLQHLILKSNGTGINITTASPIIKNVVFDNLGRGVSMTGIGSAPVIENSVFNNSTYPLETSLLCFPASLAGNTFSGTSYKGIKVVAETLNQNVSLAPRPFGEMENAPYIFDNYTVNAELTITPGVKCKFLDGRGLTVNRWLKAIGKAESSIVFTSIRDDYYGGDTNADGAATPANASYWNGITFADATIDADCILSNVIVKNAYEAVTTNNASPQLTNVTFYTNRNAVQAVGASNPLITDCDFVGQSQRAINNVNQSFTIQATNCWWGSNEGPVVAASPSGNRQAVSDGVNFVPFRTNGLNQPLLGDVSTNGVLQAYDASLVLQAAVGTLTLEAHQEFAADVSGDGLITAYDATLILEYVAGLRPNMPGGLKSAQAEDSKPTLRIASGDIYRESDLYLPINLEGTPPSVGVDIVLSYDPSLLQAVEVVPMSGSGFMQAVRIDNLGGRLYLAAAATKGQVGSEWNLVRFRLMDKLDASSETAVSADLFRVNEIDLTAAAISGTVRYNVITGINASSKSATLTCYPNPASDILYLSGATMGSELSIFDGKGQKLQSMILTESSINLSSLNSGLYYIVITNNKDTQRAKFLKK